MHQLDQICNPNLHLSRRTLLGAGVGGLMMSSLARRLARADESGLTPAGRPKSVILLWMQGGPSQLETFDPHQGTAYGGDVKAIDTSAKGIQIADTLPNVAQQMHLASLVRSVTGKEGDHERAVYNAKTGFRPDPTLIHPSIGAALCKASDAGADIPRHISISSLNYPGRGGYLGAKYDAFTINDPAGPVPDVRRPVDKERYQKRLQNLDFVEQQFARGRLKDLDNERTQHIAARKAALKMMSSEQLSAFDVSEESASERKGFGDNKFGRGCLAASRLIEVGARCVEVTLGGWDSHVNNHSLQTAACETLDLGLAALLRRLEERDLLDTTLVVCAGEFGRTPQLNPTAGRDHWPHGFSTLLAGCSIRKGVVHGETAAKPKLDPDKPLDDINDPVTVADLHATILKAIDVPYEHEEDTPVGRPMKVSEGTPIKSLLA